MKVILSRKGFDSSNGGIPSPIMEDGQLIPFPIPSCDLDRYDDLYYKDDSYHKLVSDLKYKGGETCHVDPDLTLNNRKKEIEEEFICPKTGHHPLISFFLLFKVRSGSTWQVAPPLYFKSETNF